MSYSKETEASIKRMGDRKSNEQYVRNPDIWRCTETHVKRLMIVLREIQTQRS